MSIAVLHQLYNETRRLAIAGSSVAAGDFRLKKLIPALEQAGAKSPVFAKLSQCTNALIESDEKSSPMALLELGTLITSVLYTQGETGIEGDLEPINSIDFGLTRTQTPAKLLKPLLDALTSQGSGRLEVIRSSHEQGFFRDLRLVRPALLALDDSYSEISDFVAVHVLPMFGPALLPELEAQFDPKGKTGHTRRLLLMHKLDPVRATTHVRTALEEGNPDMRVTAIECMGSSIDDLPFLLQQVKSKAKDVRRAAFKSLSRMKLDQAEAVLIAQIDGSDLENACEALRLSESSAVIAVLIERTREQVKTSLVNPATATKSKSKTKGDTNAQLERLQLLLSTLYGRNDPGTEKLHLDLLDSIEQIALLKGAPSGKDIVNSIARNLAAGSSQMKRMLCKQHAMFSEDVVGEIFTSACEVWTADEVFTQFEPYVTAYGKSNKKKLDNEGHKGKALVELVNSSKYDYFGYIPTRRLDVSRLSKQWLDLAIELELGDLVIHLASLDKEKSKPALQAMYSELINAPKSASNPWHIYNVLDAMIRVDHPEATDSVLHAIQKLSDSSSYYTHWIFRLVSTLPVQETLPKLEALLPKLPEKVANNLIDVMVMLKQKS